jgi:hypothetical protein
MSGVKLFQLLKSKMGDREADALITYVDHSIYDRNQDIHAKMLSTFATKTELFATKTELKEEIGKVREDLARVEGRLETKIVEVKSDVLRWMFAFLVTMLLAILGLYLKK